MKFSFWLVELNFIFEIILFFHYDYLDCWVYMSGFFYIFHYYLLLNYWNFWAIESSYNCSPFFFESLRVLYLLLVWSYMICIVTHGYFNVQSFIVILIWDLCLLFHVSAPSQMHSFCWCLLFLIHGILMQLELIRFIASDKPLIAAHKVSERTVTIIENLLQSPIPAQVC